MINWTSSKIKPTKKGKYIIKIYDKRKNLISYRDASFNPEIKYHTVLNADKSHRNIGWSYCGCCADGNVIGWCEL
jgi:hypothetical protein